MEASDGIELKAELAYADPERALIWLSAAFGFETRMIVRDEARRPIFAEIGLGGHTIAVVPEKAWLRSPGGGAVAAQAIQVRFSNDIEAHLARARTCGATILREPESFFFGDRGYEAADLEGHVWAFNQRVDGAGGLPPAGWTVEFPAAGESQGA